MDTFRLHFSIDVEKLQRFSCKQFKSEIQSLLESICFPRPVNNINNMTQIVQDYKFAECSLGTFLNNLFHTFKHHFCDYLLSFSTSTISTSAWSVSISSLAPMMPEWFRKLTEGFQRVGKSSLVASEVGELLESETNFLREIW